MRAAQSIGARPDHAPFDHLGRRCYHHRAHNAPSAVRHGVPSHEERRMNCDFATQAHRASIPLHPAARKRRGPGAC